MRNKIFGEPVILVVDDQATDVRILTEAVRDLGQVYFVTDGRSALEAARRWRPDVVLLDIQMPDMNGFAVCKALKSDPKTCDSAVIFVTSHTQTENELRALDYGGVHFLQKPLNIPVARAHIKAHIALRSEAKKLANHDALTELPNRTLLHDRTDQALQQARHSRGKVALLLIDLDHFKAINDAVGHAIGDAVLQVVATRLKEYVRVIDTVSRQGGDSFMVLMPELENFDAVGDFSAELLSIISKRIYVEDMHYDVTASIGIGLFPDDSDTLESLYWHADTAMYQAKQHGRNTYCFFSAEIETSLRARHQLELSLRSALEQGDFRVFYQSKVDARTCQVVGIEALVRLCSNGVIVLPNQFIPLAEETGLIIPIGEFVLRQACYDAKSLSDRGHAIPVSVNISAQQFQVHSFLDMVKAILSESGLEPNMLELEITEGVLVQDIDITCETLAALRGMGIRISVDDFGTGYSSLAYLKRFPVNILKIDQSFVRTMLEDKSDAAIVATIIKLAQVLGLELVAEGVETEEQAQALLSLGCHVMQGYLYCRPIPFSGMSVLLDNNK
ncbi:EAL domain-containing protein [Pseudomonas sp. MH10]|uniref:putative bifunctional diguanylate cyclase/phosphodiesterase n=1 Tax=Pseudomonas sp. MH10 TaxID=3048627 RepID=UPI002AC8A80B|nr:EAL domain-containing protein [Pseudomonas sp. MH10]MEB0039499.1 EAL domain-containing protein [Pseudomonas sp. MH10]WPX62433.1 EAL domain-containing protein [Pseudomonas sp. MH10]